MFRIFFALIGICNTGTVNDHIRTVDGTKVDHFIRIGDVQFIKVCVQSLDLHRVKYIIQCTADLSTCTCNPYF